MQLFLPNKLTAGPFACIIKGSNRRFTMGIHYDYKNTRGAKKLQKQHEREQRRRSKKAQQKPEQKPDETRPLTLDMITDPDK